MMNSRSGWRFLSSSARVIAPVPAPISSTDDFAGSTVDAISCESFAELGASAPIAFGFSSSERRKTNDSGGLKIIAYLEDNVEA